MGKIMKNYVGAPLAGALALLAATAAQGAGPAVPPWGVALKYVDNSVKPGDDFFVHANGNWLKTDVIPPDRSYSGVNLELNQQNEARLKDIVAALNGIAAPSAEERKLRDLYADFLAVVEIEKASLKPVQADLKRIAALKTHRDVAAAIAAIDVPSDGPFGLYIGVDDKNPDAYSINLGQSGLGLPDRDYYLKNDKEFADIRAAYKTYLARMLGFAGVKDAGPHADAILKLETAIAGASWPAEDRREQDKIYNPMPFGALKTLAPDYDWDAAFAAAHIPTASSKGERQVIVAEKSAFPELAKIFKETPVAVWRDYLTVRLLGGFASYLPKAIDDAQFDFYGKVLSGNDKQLDRQTRGIELLDGRLGEALGKLYVAKYFPPESKAKALALVNNLLKAYEQDIQTLAWMSPETRAKALDKLHRYTLKIGYPDRWRDYAPLDIKRGDLVGNIKRSNAYEWHRQIERLDRPVDKSEWGMTPQTNNAYYNPATNEIAFPAGILQPPYFDPDADDAVNYGEIGATIGHEISHGFDDQGSKYDGLGYLRDWWTELDRKNFDARTAALAKQYDAYEPLPGLHINGKLTLGENIADLAGLVIARKAYHLALDGKPAPVLDGLTGDQRFYIAYAQSWRERWRDGRMRQVVLSNPHSPSAYRVNGVVRNDDGWYEAFDVKPGDKYYLPPDQRVRLW
jgi:putative endopeptidase